MLANDLREDAETCETSCLLRAHVVKSEINGYVVDVHGEEFQQLLGTVIGERIGVGTGGAFGVVDYAGGVVVKGHVWEGAEVRPVIGRCGGRIVLDQNTSVVVVNRLRSTVTEPDQIPSVSVGRKRCGILRRLEEGLASERKILELRTE